MIHFHDAKNKVIHPLTYVLFFLLGIALIIFISFLGNRNRDVSTVLAVINLNSRLTRIEKTDSLILTMMIKNDKKDSIQDIIFEHLPTKVPIDPANITSISSTFGKRINPITQKPEFHAAIDYRAKTGTPVMAAGAGIILKTGYETGYGNTVRISHEIGGNETGYAHLSKMLVLPGQYVNKGYVIGNVGTTGNSTGPHLHFILRSDNEIKNPSLYF